MHLATSNPSGEKIIHSSNSESVNFSRLKAIVVTIDWPKTLLYSFLSPVVLLFASTSVFAEDSFFQALQENSNSSLSQVSPVSEPLLTTPTQLEASRSISRQSQQITLPGQTTKTQTAQTGSVWRTIGALLVVLALFLLGAKLWRQHIPVANIGLPTEAIEILGRKPIEPRLSVYLIRCGSRILVVGSSADGMQTLAEVTDPVEVDYLAGICRRSDQENGFAQSLRTLFNRQSFPHSTPEQAFQSFEVDDDENEKIIGQLNIEPSLEFDQQSETVHA
jgi:flagellar biogenesis protein FliO